VHTTNVFSDTCTISKDIQSLAQCGSLISWAVSEQVNSSRVARDAVAAAEYQKGAALFRNSTLSASCLSFIPVYECARQFPVCSADSEQHAVCTFVCDEYKRRCRGQLRHADEVHCGSTGPICSAGSTSVAGSVPLAFGLLTLLMNWG